MRDERQTVGGMISQALERLEETPLRFLLQAGVQVCLWEDAAEDALARVESGGVIRLNAGRIASAEEAVCVVARCLLHLGMGHFQQPLLEDPAWRAACAAAAVQFLPAVGIRPLPELQALKELPAMPETGHYQQMLAEGVAPSAALAAKQVRLSWQGNPPPRFAGAFACTLQEALRREMMCAETK